VKARQEAGGRRRIALLLKEDLVLYGGSVAFKMILSNSNSSAGFFE
jgi:hypothetical protein